MRWTPLLWLPMIVFAALPVGAGEKKKEEPIPYFLNRLRLCIGMKPDHGEQADRSPFNKRTQEA